MKLETERPLNHFEKSLLRCLLTSPMGWSQFYINREVDRLFELRLVEYGHISAKGKYYNSVRLTDAGREQCYKERPDDRYLGSYR